MLFLMICICSPLVFHNIQSVTAQEWTPSLYDVFIVSAGDGWAVGSGGIIYNGYGETWEEIESPTTQSIFGLYGEL